MVVANTSSGETLCFDLREADQLGRLRSLLGGGMVTALSLYAEGHTVALPRPKRFSRKPEFGADLLTNKRKELIGERVFVQAEDVRASLTLTFSSKLIRCDLVKTGRMRFNPTAR